MPHLQSAVIATIMLSFGTANAASPVIINEVHINATNWYGGTVDEAVELIFVQNTPVTILANYYFGDSTAATTVKSTAFRVNGASWAGINGGLIPSGTILVIGLGTTDTTLNPAGGDWNLLLKADDTAWFTQTLGGASGSFGNSEEVVYFDTTDAGVAITADGIALAFRTSSSVFGPFGTASGVTQVDLGPTMANGDSVQLTALPSAANAAIGTNFSRAAAFNTLGTANNGAQSIAITALRAASISEWSLLD